MAQPQRRRRRGGVFARVPQPEWLAWLEEQERKPGVFVPPNNPVVDEFDPLQERARIVEEDLGEWERWGVQGKGRNREILKRWFFTRNLENSIVSRMLDKIRQSVRARHKLRLLWGILLRNTEDNRPLFWYTNVPPQSMDEQVIRKQGLVGSAGRVPFTRKRPKARHEMSFRQGCFC